MRAYLIVFLGAGFFIKVQDEIWPVRWISYIVPTRYALNGLLDSLLAPTTYTTGYPAPNNVVSGAFLLQSVVGQPDDYNKWTDLGIVWAFVVGFRFAFLGQLFWGLRKYAAVKAGGEQGAIALKAVRAKRSLRAGRPWRHATPG